MKGYKAFEPGLICKPTREKSFQYKENTIFEQEGELEICKNGFHFCKQPLDIFMYYPLICGKGITEFAEVKALGEYCTGRGKTKYCTNKIKIGNKITFCDLIERSIREFPDKGRDAEELIITEPFEPINSRNMFAHIALKASRAKLISEGFASKIGVKNSYNTIISTGPVSKISLEASGEKNCLTVTGRDTEIASRGSFNQINISGEYVQLVSEGVGTIINSSGQDVKIVSKGASDEISTSGRNSLITSTGDQVKITAQGGHTLIKSEGENAFICCLGCRSAIRAKKGSQIAFFNYNIDTENSNSLVIAYVDGEKIKEDTWYCISEGKIVPAISQEIKF